MVKLDDTIIAIPLAAIFIFYCAFRKKDMLLLDWQRYIQNGMGILPFWMGVLHWLMAWKIQVSFKTGNWLASFGHNTIATFIGYCILIVHWRIHEQHRSIIVLLHLFLPWQIAFI